MAGYFDPTSQYGGTLPWQDTPLVKDYLEPEIPQGVYTDFLAQNGFGGMDGRNEWARQQYGRTQQGYQAAVTRNPNLSYREYLSQQFPQGMNNIWAGLTPGQRGERPNQFVGPTRLIRWG